MLTSDGLTKAQFLPLWRDAMWGADRIERARLVLEIGRAMVREEGRAAPLVVAAAWSREPPLALMPVAEPPRRRDAAAREAVQSQLADIGADEVYVLVTARGPVAEGVETFILASWGEDAEGREACWLMPYRWGATGLEEAPPLNAPAPEATVFGRELRGLMPQRH